MAENKCSNIEIAKQAEALDDADMWTKHLSGSGAIAAVCLRDLECALRCRLCSNFMRAPVTVLPCQHTFCSECIRKKFALDLSGTARKAACAYCKESVNTSGLDFGRCLAPSGSMDALVHTFQLLRAPLLEKLTQQQSQLQFNPHLVSAAQRAAAAAGAAVKGGDGVAAATEQVVAAVHDIIEAAAIVLPSLPPKLNQRRPKLARTIYKGKNKRQLVELCNSTGLSTAGTEAELQKRHADYITLYNSECDSLRPRSTKELLAVMATRDRGPQQAQQEQRKLGGGSKDYFVECMRKLKQERKILGESPNAVWSSVTTGYAEFDADMKEGFQRLVQQCRKHCPAKQTLWVDTTNYAALAAEQQQAHASAPAPTAPRTHFNSAAPAATQGCFLARPVKQQGPANQAVVTGTNVGVTARTNFGKSAIAPAAAPFLLPPSSTASVALSQSAPPAEVNPYHRRRASNPAAGSSHAAAAAAAAQPSRHSLPSLKRASSRAGSHSIVAPFSHAPSIHSASNIHGSDGRLQSASKRFSAIRTALNPYDLTTHLGSNTTVAAAPFPAAATALAAPIPYAGAAGPHTTKNAAPFPNKAIASVGSASYQHASATQLGANTRVTAAPYTPAASFAAQNPCSSASLLGRAATHLNTLATACSAAPNHFSSVTTFNFGASNDQNTPAAATVVGPFEAVTRFSNERSTRTRAQPPTASSLPHSATYNEFVSGSSSSSSDEKPIPPLPPSLHIGALQSAASTSKAPVAEDGTKRKYTLSLPQLHGSVSKKPKAPKKSAPFDNTSLIGPWDCDTCTFRNENNRSSRAKCEMCNARRNTARSNGPAPNEYAVKL